MPQQIGQEGPDKDKECKEHDYKFILREVSVRILRVKYFGKYLDEQEMYQEDCAAAEDPGNTVETEEEEKEGRKRKRESSSPQQVHPKKEKMKIEETKGRSET